MNELAHADREILIEENVWRSGLASYAVYASHWRQKWKPYKFLIKLADAIEDAVHTPNSRLIINAPPRHGKSQLVSHWLPVWYLDWFPEKRIILGAYGDSLARDWGRIVRDEFLMNEKCWTALRRDTQAVDDWRTTRDGGMRTAGVGGPIVGKGADLIIIDDPHKSWEDAMSPTSRQRLIDWFNGTLYHRAEPGASIIMIMTRWHEDDLTGYFLDRHADDWQSVSMPALADGDDDILGREEGEPLCEERFDAERLGKIKLAMGSHMFAGLYQQRPSPLAGGMIKREWFQRYSEIPENLEEYIQSWDLTFKATGRSYVVGQVWGRKGSNCYLMPDQTRERMGFPEQLRAIRMMSSRWKQTTDILIEDAADGPAAVATLKDEISGILPKPPRGSKEARLAAVSGMIEAGNVHLPDASLAPWIDDFIEEVVVFPNAVNDDQVDAMTMALNHLRQNTYNVDIALPDTGVRSSPWEFAHV